MIPFDAWEVYVKDWFLRITFLHEPTVEEIVIAARYGEADGYNALTAAIKAGKYRVTKVVAWQRAS